MFKFYGYSCTEFGSYSLLAEFHVNHKAIEQFNIKASEADKFSEYGVLAALKEKTVDGNPFDEGSKKASVSHSDKNVKYDIFSMKIIGLNDYQDTELFLTAYFKVGDKTYFYNFKTQVNENGEKEDVSTLDEACTSTVTYSIVK